MSANTSPIFAITPNIGAAQCGGTANTNSDGSGTIGTSMTKVYTAGANGDWINSIKFTPVASAASTATAATVLRIYVSSITSSTTTNANTFLIAEQAVPSITADQTTTGISTYTIPLNFALNANYTILVSSHIVNNANTNWTAVVFGGSY